MSTRRWRCRNPHCLVRHGALLGHLKNDGGLVLEPEVVISAVYLDTRRAEIVCPVCGQAREFRGAWVRPKGRASP
jgi:hypothetical protein